MGDFLRAKELLAYPMRPVRGPNRWLGNRRLVHFLVLAPRTLCRVKGDHRARGDRSGFLPSGSLGVPRPSDGPQLNWDRSVLLIGSETVPCSGHVLVFTAILQSGAPTNSSARTPKRRPLRCPLRRTIRPASIRRQRTASIGTSAAQLRGMPSWVTGNFDGQFSIETSGYGPAAEAAQRRRLIESLRENVERRK